MNFTEGLILGIVIGVALASTLWHTIVQSVWQDYKRVAADERRYFKLWMDSLSAVDNRKT